MSKNKKQIRKKLEDFIKKDEDVKSTYSHIKRVRK